MKVRSLEDHLLIEHEHGYVELREPAPALFRTRYYGTAPASVVEPVAERFAARLAEGQRVCICIDATDLAFFESAWRQRWSEWFAEHRSRLDDILLLYSSRLVMMGVALIQAPHGPTIKSYAEPADFERAIETMIAVRSPQLHAGG